MNKFYKISFEQFNKDFLNKFGDKYPVPVKDCYNAIQIPKGATKGSAGRDFYSPITFTLMPGETITIPTGIRVEMDNGVVGLIYPRSSMGLKGLYILNTTPVVDSDYFYSDNEGHIFIAIGNRGNSPLNIAAGDRFAQMILVPYLVPEDDNTDTVRNGGFGSTNK